MRIPRPPHTWDLSPKRAIQVQRELSGRVILEPLSHEPRVVAGVDAAFSRDGEYCIGGVVLWDADRRVVLEEHTAKSPLRFPYVPGLLSFREAPALIAALRQLDTVPDAIMCDGHGLAHPRRFGIACHIGVLVGIPSLGCAKSRLVGEHREPGSRRGARCRLVHRDELVGRVVRTRDGVRPVYVSPGHLIDQPGAERLVLRCAVGYRLPEPTRLADRLVARAKRARSTA